MDHVGSSSHGNDDDDSGDDDGALSWGALFDEYLHVIFNLTVSDVLWEWGFRRSHLISERMFLVSVACTCPWPCSGSGPLTRDLFRYRAVAQQLSVHTD